MRHRPTALAAVATTLALLAGCAGPSSSTQPGPAAAGSGTASFDGTSTRAATTPTAGGRTAVLPSAVSTRQGATTGGGAGPGPGTAAGASSSAAFGFAAGGGMQDLPAAQRDADLDGMRAAGAHWLRVDLAWARIQPQSADRYDWAPVDALVRAARARGLQVLGVLAYSPAWAADPACAGNPSCRPADPDRYGAFAGTAAAHFAPLGVTHWEIWNEPNLRAFFAPTPDPAYYARMLRAASARIRAAAPGAFVVSGGLSPASTGDGAVAPVEFLARVYRAGAAGSFDAVGHHPYCYEGGTRCPSTNADWSAWAQMNSTRRTLRTVMRQNGDADKQIWPTEFGAPTRGQSAVSPADQSRMILAALRAGAETSWLGPVFVYTYRDPGTDPADREDWFGVVTAGGAAKPARDAIDRFGSTAG